MYDYCMTFNTEHNIYIYIYIYIISKGGAVCGNGETKTKTIFVAYTVSILYTAQCIYIYNTALLLLYRYNTGTIFIIAALWVR